MAQLKINTDSAVSCATHIQTLNNRIRDGFPTVQKAISQLSGSWESSVSATAIGKFGEIKNKYPDARYKVVDDFVAFLFQQVGVGYEQTEDTNKSLADAFK